MSTINIQLVGWSAMSAKLQSMTPAIRAELKQAIQDETIFEAGYVKGEKLSGQVLNVRTGTLRRSISPGEGVTRVEEKTWAITGFVGTNIVYGRIHEFGGLIHRISSRGKAFTIHMPQRSFIASTFRDNLSRMKRVLAEAVARAAGA